MEFWGVEVKSGEPLKVNPGDSKIIHLSMACLGEFDMDKGSGPVALHVKFGTQKLAIGILSSENFPQLSYDLIFEKEFELSHNWKNGSVFFTGYKAEPPLESENEDSDDSDEDIPVIDATGKPELETKNGVKHDADEAKQKEKVGDPRKNEKTNEKDANDDEEDSSESDSDEDSGEDEPMVNGETKGADDSKDDDDYKETPKKTELSKKRALESSKETPVPDKKAKLATPHKTDGKSTTGGHVATPYPSKQALKAAANNKQQPKQQTPKSGGDYGCKSCNRSFKSEEGLHAHTRDKHGAK